MKYFILSLFALFFTVNTVFTQTIVLNEDFESVPYDLTSSGVIPWAINSRVQAAGLYCDSCTVGNTATSYLTTNSFATTGNTSVILEFKQICKIESGDAGQIEYSIDGGTTWTVVTLSYYLGAGSFASNKFTEFSYPTTWQAGVGTAVPQNTWWKTEQFDLGVLVGNQADVKIRFKLNDANNNGPNQRTGWYVDDVKITIAPSELVPPTITLVPTIYQDTIFNSGPFNIKAKISDISGIDTAFIVYSVNAGLNDTLGMSVLVADTFNVTLPAQPYNTRIDYYIVATDASLAANSAATTGYWFITKRPSSVVVIGNGSSTSVYTPAYGNYDYGWSEMSYSTWEINSSGFISEVSFRVQSTPGTYTYNDQRVYLYTTTDSVFSAASFPDTTTMTRIFQGNFTVSDTGWTTISLATPIYYDGTQNLNIAWINNDGDYSYGPTFYCTSTSPSYKTKYDYADYTFPTGTGDLTYTRPDIRLYIVPDLVNNVTMADITEPVTSTSLMTGATFPVKVTITNLGSAVLSSATINWSVDGILQPSYAWSGSLAQFATSPEFQIGTSSFLSAGSGNIKVWTSLPNGMADEDETGDTLLRNYNVCDEILAGTYTINPVVPTGGTNFQYFADALNALGNCGISDTTVFNIVPGTYDTLLNIPVIPGAGSSADVTFQSSTGLASDVILQNEADTVTDNYIFNLNGTDYFNIRNLTIQALGSDYANCIVLDNDCRNILIDGNQIEGKDTALSSDYLNLIHSPGSSVDSNIVISNNTLLNGSTAINIVSSSVLNNNIAILNNTINNYYYSAIQTEYCSGVTIDTNVIASDVTPDYSYGVYMNNCENANVRMNRISHANYSALYLYYVSNPTSGGNITNNFLSVGGDGDSYTLYAYESSDLKIYHNSVNCYSTASSYAYSFYDYYGSDNEIFNNIFANTGNGYALFLSYASDTLNYNNLYSTGTYLAEFNYSDYSDLASYQAASGMDANSVSADPMFINNTELHTLAFSNNDQGFGVGVIDDIDGDVRNLATPDMGADEFTPPMQEAGIISYLSPTGGCGLGMENIEIQIVCNGLDTIDGNLTAYYTVDGGAPVSQAIATQILPGDTLDFTFTTQADFSVGATDQMFQLETWITLTGDPIPVNDTLLFSVASLHSPAPVVVSNATIPYGTSATLNATSTDTIQWYADPALATLLETGSSYTTPVLYDTTVYYVASTSGVKYNYTFDTDLQGWSALANCTGYTTYNWAWNTDAGEGTAFMENASTESGAMLLSPVLNVFGTDVSLSFTHRFETESCCDHGYVAYRLDGGAWMEFIPSTGTYTSSGSLDIDPAIGNCGYYSPAGTFSGTSGYMTSSGNILLNGGTQLEVAFLFSSDGSVSYDGWYIDEVLIEKPGCPGQISPDTVFVTGIPAVDVGVIAIDTPNDGVELSNYETVTVRVKNYGTAAASNIPVNYTINAGTAVTETLSGPVNPGDTATYVFTTGANLSAVGTYEIAAYTTLTGDLITVNDTVKKLVVCSPMIYCASGATNTGDEDILNVTLGSLNNTSPAPHTMTYTDYTSVPPAYLSHGQTFQMSVTETDDAAPYYSGYIEAYIDFNHDGIYQEPEEVVLGGAYTSANQTNTITGNVTIPLSAYTGTTRMRVICWEGSTATTVVPCGTYGFGETEDYLVTIAPQIPNDAGVVSIDSPGYIQSEDSQVPVVVTVRNYGTNTLTSIPVEYVLNGGTPVAYTWTGSLAPNTTTQITLPDVTVLPDSNEICAYTIVVDDTNYFNDNTCAWFYGLPPAIIFEDDMENGTQLYTDAPTLWEHGVPTADVINIANSPDNVWATILDGDYPNSASGFVYTPNMNFFGVNGAYLTFYYWIDAEENNDGGYIQYSTNNGSTWSSLGTINDPDGFNWFESYASGTPAWSKPTNGWKPAFIKLDVVSGFSIVKFRFGFKSNPSITNNGFAIDDIKILGPAVAIDGGVVEIVAPATSTATGAATTVTVKIKNFGTDTLTSIPVSYALNTGFPPQNGTWTGTLLPDSTVDYTFTQTYPGPSVDYELCAYTKITGDPYKGNDTTCVLFDDVIGMDEESVNSVSLLQNIPNPASAQTEISFTLPAPGKCVLTLRNTLGELIQTTTIDGQSGKNSVNVDLSRLSQGIYVYTLEYKDVVLTRRLSVIK